MPDINDDILIVHVYGWWWGENERTKEWKQKLNTFELLSNSCFSADRVLMMAFHIKDWSIFHWFPLKSETIQTIDRAFVCMHVFVSMRATRNVSIHIFHLAVDATQKRLKFISFSVSYSLHSTPQQYPCVIFNYLIKHTSNQFHQSKCVNANSMIFILLFCIALLPLHSNRFHSIQIWFYWMNLLKQQRHQ